MATTDTETTQETVPRPFADMLGELEAGFLETDLDERLTLIVDAVKTQGKAATLALKLAVKPVPGTDGMVQIVATVGHVLPKVDRAPSTFFLGRGGRLSREHPSQLTDPNLQPAPRTPETPTS